MQWFLSTVLLLPTGQSHFNDLPACCRFGQQQMKRGSVIDLCDDSPPSPKKPRNDTKVTPLDNKVLYSESKRLYKERQKFSGPQFGLTLLQECQIQHRKFSIQWIMQLQGPDGSQYEGELFTLRIRFPKDYPMEAPEVEFQVSRSPADCQSDSHRSLTLSLIPEPHNVSPPFVPQVDGELGCPSPSHEHIYTNGHICLDLLHSGWSPAMSVESVCVSIQSMLSSATRKQRPPGKDHMRCASTTLESVGIGVLVV